MELKKILDKSLLIAIIVIIVINFFLIFKMKSNSNSKIPFGYLNIKNPTFILILDEFECNTCVRNLLFLNNIYHDLKDEGTFDFIGVILSKHKTDQKNISEVFEFPFVITDDFNILKRLNLNQTPLIVGLSKDRRIYYCDLIPFETTLSEEYIKKGILDRLYYSASQ